MQEFNYFFKVETNMFCIRIPYNVDKLLSRKPILTVPLLSGGWPVRGGCMNSTQSSAELCVFVAQFLYVFAFFSKAIKISRFLVKKTISWIYQLLLSYWKSVRNQKVSFWEIACFEPKKSIFLFFLFFNENMATVGPYWKYLRNSKYW